MSRLLWNAVRAIPVVFGAFFSVLNSILAAPTIAGEIAPGYTVVASTEKPTLSVKLVSEPYTQLPQKWVEESNLSPVTSVKVSPSVVLSDSTLAEPMPVTGAATPDSSSTLEPINLHSNEGSVDDPMGQVTNVSPLSDVSPGDWAYEAKRCASQQRFAIAC